MIRAAGVLVIVGGVALVYASMAQILLGLVMTPIFLGVAALIIGGGISAIRKSSFAWAFAAAVCLVPIGAYFGVVFGRLGVPEYLFAPRLIEPTIRVPYVVTFGISGVLGLLAVILLAKGKRDFQR